MKKIIYILFIVAGIFTSCEDYLEVDPTNVTVIKEYNDVKSLMGACLSEYTTSNEINGVNSFYSATANYLTFTYYSGQLEDETYLDTYMGRNNRQLFYSSLQWYQPSLHKTLWKDLYESIGFYNTVIDELNNLENVTEDDANIILGEAKFLRAWNFFKLMQYFSPYDRDDLGIPVNLDANYVLTYDKSRRTQTEVYNIIISELEEILMYETKPTDFNIFYDKQLINALLAQVYHFKGGSGAGETTDYDKAIEYANKAIEGETLTTYDGVAEMFNVEDNGIFKEHPTALLVSEPFYWRFYSVHQSISGMPDYGMAIYASERMINLFSADDIRSEWVNASGEIYKFANIDVDCPFFFFRIADLHLIIAESYARNGEEEKAKTYLEEFQSNRINNYTGYNGTDVLQEILNERKREFCYEYDMLWIEMVRTRKGFSRPAVDDEAVETYTLEDGDYRLTQPIPVHSELENNKIDQNPGWNI